MIGIEQSPCWTRPNVNPLTGGFGCRRSTQLRLLVPILLVEASYPPVIKHNGWLANLLITEIVWEKNGLRNGICHCYAWLLECKQMVEERHGSCNSKSFPKSSRHVINLGTSSVSSSSTSASIGSTDSSPEGSSAAPGASGASGAQRCETSPVLRAGWSNMKEPRVPTIVLLCSILVDMAGRTSYRNPGSV